MYSREAGKTKSKKTEKQRSREAGKHRTRNPKIIPKPAAKKIPKINSHPFRIIKRSMGRGRQRFPKQGQFIHFFTRPEFSGISFHGLPVSELLFDFGEGN
jgi:hypothetical protein